MALKRFANKPTSGIPLISKATPGAASASITAISPPWPVPDPADLPALPTGSPGYGCLADPRSPLGAALFNASDVKTPADACPKGFFCPYLNISDPNTLPVMCPALPECTLLRLYGLVCQPQGRYEPVACPGGYYCPDYKSIIPCPADFFCISGTADPRPCEFLSSCPTGTIIPTHYGLLVIVLIIDVFLVAFIVVRRSLELKREGLPQTFLLPAFIRRLLNMRGRSRREKDEDEIELENWDALITDDTRFYQETPWVNERASVQVLPPAPDPSEDKKKLVPPPRRHSLAVFGPNSPTLGLPELLIDEHVFADPVDRAAAGSGGDFPPVNASDSALLTPSALALNSPLATPTRPDLGYHNAGSMSPLPLLPVLAPSPAPTLGEWSIAPNMNTAGLVEAFEKACGGVRAGKEVSMNFQFSGLSLRLPTTGKWILRGVTGEIRSGSMTAVMGPSGAGKTTFMNVLMGKVKRTGGELKINGTVAEMEQFKKLIGYVPQEDIMLRELTAREVITYAARIRLPDSWAKQEIDAHVDNVLKALNLEEVAHTPIGNELTRGISGGQRKRVNIGMELAAAPLALFLDEPTSGLDATAALDVARILQTVSRIGLTVVSVIHQPRVEIFKSFDNVLMIVPGGRTAYLGPVALSQPYFEALGFVFEPNANPADVLMDILAGRGIFTRGGSSTPSKGDLVKIWAAWGRTLFADPSATALVRGAIPPSSLWPWSTSLGGQTSSPTTAAPSKTSSNDSTGPSASSSSSTPPPADALAAMRSLAHVRGATLLTQTLESHNRAVVQQFRFLSAFWMELFVGMFAGAVMGIAANVTEAFRGVLRAPFQGLSSAPQDWFVALYGMLIGVAVSLAASPPAVKVFGEEKSVYYREAASGHSKIAYYIGKTLASFYRIALASAHFTAVYYLLAKPALPVALQFVLLFLNFYAIYGVATIISFLVPRQDAPLLAVVVGLFLGVFCGFGPSLTPANQFLFDFSPNRWAAEAQFGLWIGWYRDVYDVGVSTALYGYTIDQTTRNLLAMFALGTGYRVVGFALMVLLHRDKQR